jgi:hypothetical protein
MSLTMHRASVPVFIRGLEVLDALLTKAEAHAKETGIDPAVLVGARLAPDMFTLAGQIQRASDASKLAVQRLSAGEAPRFDDNETTLPELRTRIASTITYLRSVTPEQLAGSDTRLIELKAGSHTMQFVGINYLFEFALPNFYFHVTTAYGILRNQGLKIGKLDYLGPFS